VAKLNHLTVEFNKLNLLYVIQDKTLFT